MANKSVMNKQKEADAVMANLKTPFEVYAYVLSELNKKNDSKVSNRVNDILITPFIEEDNKFRYEISKRVDELEKILFESRDFINNNTLLNKIDRVLKNN